jgi:hypothetical protein
MTPQHRVRPVLTVTINADHLRRLRAVARRMPGRVGVSALTDEMFAVTLPVFEQIAEAYEEMRGEDGLLDLDALRERMALYLANMMLKATMPAHDTKALDAGGGDSG